MIGPGGAGKTRLALDAIMAQAAFYGGGNSGTAAAVAPPGGVVRCVLALAGRPDSEVQVSARGGGYTPEPHEFVRHQKAHPVT